MAKRPKRKRGIALPWERQRSWWSGLLVGARWKLAAWIALIVLCSAGVWQASVRRSAERTTRLAIVATRTAISDFRVDEGRCPASFEELIHPPRADRQYLRQVPTDGWNQILFMRCPGRFDPDDADVASAGPSGSFFADDTLQ